MKKILKLILKKININKPIIDSFYPIKHEKIRAFKYRLYLKRCGWASTFDKSIIIKFPENIQIGEYVTLNSFIHIWAGPSGLKIGNRVMIASHVAITTLTHDYTSYNMRFDPAIDKSIEIEDDVWIGSHAVIMPGVKIGKGAVIGAGSIVTKDIPPFCIAVGAPAKILKSRF